MRASVTVRISIGALLLTAFLVGCVGQVDNPLQPVSPPGGRLYIANSGDNSLLIFGDILNAFGPPLPIECALSGSTTTCNLNPTEKIQNLKSQDLIRNPFGVFVDTINDRLYVANAGRYEILIFNNASAVNGVSVPDRVISGNFTTLNSPHGLALDTTNDILYVANTGGDDILVFDNASTIDGDVTPSRTISGLDRPSGLFLDTAGDRLYAANSGQNSILVFDNASSPTTLTPARTITFSNSSSSLPIPSLSTPSGIYVDVNADPDANSANGTGVLYVANNGNNSMLVFNNASTATGETVPSRSVSGSQVNLSDPAGLFVDNNVRVLSTSTSLGTFTTLNDSTQSFTPGQYVNFIVVITSGTGQGQARTITGNTNNQLTVSPQWNTRPDASSTYEIRGDFIYAVNQGNSSILVLNNASTVDNSFFVSGKATGGASSTLNDTTQSFPDQVKGLLVEITHGTGAGQVRTITNNTPSNTLSVSPNWIIPPDATSTYQIRPGFRNIAGASTTLSGPGGIFVDAANNQFYVANPGADSILVFKNASTTLTAAILSTDTTIPVAPTTDFPSSGLIGIQDEIISYAGKTPTSFTGAIRGVNGTAAAGHPSGFFIGNLVANIAPNRTIQDAAAPPASPGSAFADVTRDILYMAEAGSILILEHASTLNNTLPPVATTVSVPSLTVSPFAITVDTTQDRLFAAIPSSVLVFDNASTTPTPGTPILVPGSPVGLFVDSDHNFLYAAISTSVLGFDSVTGSPIPALNITSGLSSPVGLFIDSTRDLLYVADSVANSILVYSQASTSPTLLHTITGPMTTLNSPTGIFADSENNLLYVSNTGTNSILVFNNANTINGNVAPSEVISGTATTLNVPLGIFVDVTR